MSTSGQYVTGQFQLRRPVVNCFAGSVVLSVISGFFTIYTCTLMETVTVTCLHTTLFSRVFLSKERNLITAPLVCTKNILFPLLPLLNMSADIIAHWPGTRFSSEDLMKNKVGEMPKYVGLIDLFDHYLIFEVC